jgi:ketosteroid isomerase-like protein
MSRGCVLWIGNGSRHHGRLMDQTKAFLEDVMPRQLEAERALHDGTAGARLAMWSEREPVTLLGAATGCMRGAASVRAAFDQVAASFRDCTSFDIEVLAAEAVGDLAYTVVIERTSCTRRGTPVSYQLRATHVYRREEGEWRIVHRHADPPPDDEESVRLWRSETGGPAGQRAQS